MSEMVWTRTKPDRPGWWWWKNKSEKGIAEIQCRGDGIWYRIIDGNTWCGINNTGDGVEWSSRPIPEPSEPPEHPLVQELRKLATQESHHWRDTVHKIADKLQAALSGKDA